MFILFFSFSLFILINLIFSIFWNQNTSSSNNIKVNNNFTEYLYENTSERDDIYFSSKLLHSFSLTTNLIEKNIEVRNSPLTEKYYVIMKSTEYPAKKTNLEKFYDMLSALLNIERKKDSSEKQIDFKNENYILDKEFDQVLIYINKNY